MPDGWAEVRLAATASGQLIDMLVPADEGTVEVLDRLTGREPGEVQNRVQPGERIAVATCARDWLRQALASLDAGRVVVVDAFVPVTGPVGDEPPPLPLDQLASVRRPLHPAAPAFAHLQAVEWDARR